jgi:hypothetical protein
MMLDDSTPYLGVLLNVECNCLACLLWRLPLMVHICEVRDMNADYIRKYAVFNDFGYFTAFLSVIRLILWQYLAAEERFLPYPLQVIIIIILNLFSQGVFYSVE